MSEFSLIRRFFAPLAPAGEGICLGIGDDGAVVQVPAGHELVVTADMLVAGRHFPENTAPRDIGWKSLAVNLSDLAAMGAEPRWFTLALALPRFDEAWVQAFAAGFGELARRHAGALIGGDITRGPLTISVTAMGVVPAGSALQRRGAAPGDWVGVTGELGDAAAALAGLGGAALRRRLDRPQPRLRQGQALRGLASAVIDISDGLLADLGHICEASVVGADLEASRLPASAALVAAVPDAQQRWRMQATGGDDYELCVCIPPQRLDAARSACRIELIGRISDRPGVRLRTADGTLLAYAQSGYDHFA